MFILDELLNAARGRFLGGDPGGRASGVSIDSRTIRKGDLFVALRGDRFDGHDFLAAALDRGAAGVVIQDVGRTPRPDPGPREGGAFWIGVDDTLRALQDLAAFHRRRFSLPVVGITGTNGKTTTKEMTAAVLRTRFPVCATVKNLNNHIGVPLTLFGLTAEHRAAVLEMGISAPGELRRLCEIAAPGMGVITNIGPAHLEGFRTIDAVAEAKAEILDGMGKEGEAVLNADDPYFGMLEKRGAGRITTFGMTGRADVSAAEVRETFDGGIPRGLAFTLRTPVGEGEVSVSAVGVHNVSNALAAAAVGFRLGLTFEEIQSGLGDFVPLPLRMAPIRLGDLDILNDAYNANPGSMAAALEVLAGLRKGRQGIAVLGEMLELGEFAPTAHRDLGRRVGELGIDGLVAVGTHAAAMAEGARERGMAVDRVRICADSRRAIEAVRELLTGKAVLLVKGSRGMEMEKVVQGLMEAP